MPFTPEQAAQVRAIYDATQGGGESGDSGAQGSDQQPSAGQKRGPSGSAAPAQDKPQTKKEARQQVMDSSSPPPRSRTADGKFASSADQGGQDQAQPQAQPQDQQIQQGTGPNPGFVPKSRFDQVLRERREAKAEFMELQAKYAELEKRLQGGGGQQPVRQAAEPEAQPAQPQPRFEGFAQMPDFAAMLPPNEQFSPHFKALLDHMGSFQNAVEVRMAELGQSAEQYQQFLVQKQLDDRVAQLSQAFPHVPPKFWLYATAHGVSPKQALKDWDELRGHKYKEPEPTAEDAASESDQSASTVPPRPARTVSQPEEPPKKKPTRAEMRAELFGFADKVSRG